MALDSVLPGIYIDDRAYRKLVLITTYYGSRHWRSDLGVPACRDIVDATTS